METKHTPGPWELAWEQGKHGVVASAAGGKLVAIIGNNTPDDGNEPIRLANARLIAAAPDLLALAQRVAALNENCAEIGHGMLTQLVTEARAALSKAKES